MDPIQPQNQPLTPQPGDNPGLPASPPPQQVPEPGIVTPHAPVDTLGGDPMLAGLPSQAPQAPAAPQSMPSAPDSFQSPSAPQGPDLPPAAPEAFSPQPLVSPGISAQQPPVAGPDQFANPGGLPPSPQEPLSPATPASNIDPAVMPPIAGMPDATVNSSQGGGSKKVLGIVIVVVGILALLGIIGFVVVSL